MSGERTLAWFHCFSGIAGDMALASLLDAGADVDEVVGLVERLPLRGWQLTVEPVLRAGIGATHVVVRATDDGVVRTYAHISGLIDEARLPERVRHRAQATFAVLAQAEGRLHRRAPEQVHFHEVGGVDAIVDVVGVCAALEGVTALLAMLSSCAAGLTVVGIDNGFGAACAVLRMLPA